MRGADDGAIVGEVAFPQSPQQFQQLQTDEHLHPPFFGKGREESSFFGAGEKLQVVNCRPFPL
jgi:hypothetical protein